jgi:hypothetical protein
MKVSELKQELRKRKCPIYGKKEELIAQLKKALAEGALILNQRNKKGTAFKESRPKPKQLPGLGLTSFKAGTKWKLLVANEEVMAEPDNPTCIRT